MYLHQESTCMSCESISLYQYSHLSSSILLMHVGHGKAPTPEQRTPGYNYIKDKTFGPNGVHLEGVSLHTYMYMYMYTHISAQGYPGRCTLTCVLTCLIMVEICKANSGVHMYIQMSRRTYPSIHDIVYCYLKEVYTCTCTCMVNVWFKRRSECFIKADQFTCISLLHA